MTPTYPPDYLGRDISSHYSQIDEPARTTRGPNQLEFLRTQRTLLRHLPPPPAVIIDVGGAAGTYSFWLASLGYTVHLIDAFPRHIEEAKALNKTAAFKLASAEIDDARSFDLPNPPADAVLVMGPLYHIHERSGRLDALKRAIKAVRPGGLIVAAAISRFASQLDGLFRGFLDDPIFQQIVGRDLKDGCHFNPTNNPAYFTTAFFHHPDELRQEIADAGLSLIELLGMEGPCWLLQNFDEHWNDPARRQRLIEAADRLGAEPTMLGASAHLLAVARRN